MNNQNEIVIAVGMPRAGSTWLYRNLSSHPHANLSTLKETNFFSINYDRGVNWFDRLYRSNGVAPQIRFDVSPFYFLDPEFIEHVKNSGLKTKLIVILREPDTWIRSLYYQVKSYTPSMPKFEDFIHEYTIKFDSRSRTVRLSQFDFLARVYELIEAFQGNIMLINFDLIKADPLSLLQKIESFSGLPKYYNETNVIATQVNASQSQFSLLAYLSTNRFLRTVASFLPAAGIVNLLKRILYKEGRSELKGINDGLTLHDKGKYELLVDKSSIDELFPPVYQKAFFKTGNIVNY